MGDLVGLAVGLREDGGWIEGSIVRSNDGNRVGV